MNAIKRKSIEQARINFMWNRPKSKNTQGPPLLFSAPLYRVQEEGLVAKDIKVGMVPYFHW